jgi:hypothetical protein
LAVIVHFAALTLEIDKVMLLGGCTPEMSIFI